jgi:hypothetical protein
MVSLVVFSLLDVLHLVLNTVVGEVVALSWKGATVHGLPFVAFILLRLDRGGSLMVVPVMVFVVVGMMICANPTLEQMVLTPVWSRLFSHMLTFEFQVGDMRNVWLIESGCSRHMTGDKGWFSSHIPVVSKTYIDGNPLGFMPNLLMRGVDKSIDNEEMLSA